MTHRSEPALARWLLKLVSSGTENDWVAGDLLEQYQSGRSRLWYWRQVLAIILLGAYRNTTRPPLIRTHKGSAGQGIGLLLLFGFLCASLLTLAAEFLIPILVISLAGVLIFVYINARNQDKPLEHPESVVPTPLYHPGISMHHIQVEGAVGFLFVLATGLIFGVGVRAIREILILTVPLGIVGAGLLLYWHRHHPVKLQGLGLGKRK